MKLECCQLPDVPDLAAIHNKSSKLRRASGGNYDRQIFLFIPM